MFLILFPVFVCLSLSQHNKKATTCTSPSQEEGVLGGGGGWEKRWGRAEGHLIEENVEGSHPMLHQQFQTVVQLQARSKIRHSYRRPHSIRLKYFSNASKSFRESRLKVICNEEGGGGGNGKVANVRNSPRTVAIEVWFFV